MNTHPYTKEEILPKPKDKYQNFVHMCDYLASRSNLDMTYSDDVVSALGGIDIPKEELPDIDSYVIAFGKYSGKTLPQIKEIDPGYISWAKENMSREPIKSLLAQL